MREEERHPVDGPDAAIWVSFLSAMTYCERLFYIEQVEGIQRADANVLEGRAVHVAIEGELDPDRRFEDADLGLVGRVDVLRDDGQLVPWEVKKGKGRRTKTGLEPWPNERIQLGAYALLIEAGTERPVTEGRIHYVEDGATIRVVIDEALRDDVRGAIARARDLLMSRARPAPTTDERKCWSCSLAPVCLPEEDRAVAEEGREALRLYPAGYDTMTLHVQSGGTRLGKSGEQLVVNTVDGKASKHPAIAIGEVVIHGGVQISTQALTFCMERGIAVHWLSGGGRYVTGALPVRAVGSRRRAQYAAFSDDERCVALARRLVIGKLRQQQGYLMRCRRERRPLMQAELGEAIDVLKVAITAAERCDSLASLLGHEGNGARAYFKGLGQALLPGSPDWLRPSGRTRRPPRDAFNCLLSFGYSLLYKDVLAAINVVGLDPSFGFYHQQRSAGQTLALDVMELFRVALVDMPVLGSVNRQTWGQDDFEAVAGGVYLTAAGRKKAIGLFETRKQDEWRHPVLGYSLSYARLIEVEVRLLEKTLQGEADLFAQVRIR